MDGGVVPTAQTKNLPVKILVKVNYFVEQSRNRQQSPSTFLQLVNMLQVSSKSLALSSNSPGLRYAWLKEMLTSDDYRAARQRSIDLPNGNALNAWLNSMGSQDFEGKTSNK